MPELAALFVALALFWLSTRQFPLIARVGVWILGSLALATAVIVSNATKGEFGLAAAIGDAFKNGLSNSSLLRAVLLNAQMVEPAFRELFGFFLISGIVLALLALLAFTRGELLERALRPTILALVGFVAGSVATLAVVTIGFGGFSRPQVFSATLGEVSTITFTDADTFRIGDFNLRLYGADALEHDQLCNGLENRICGAAASAFLKTLLANGVQCDQTLSRRGRPRDSLGRALVRCLEPYEGDARIDVAEELIRNGFAVQYRGDDYGYGQAQLEARTNRRGLWAGCTLRPDYWRNNDTARVAFQNNAPVADEYLVGACGSTDIGPSTAPALGEH